MLATAAAASLAARAALATAVPRPCVRPTMRSAARSGESAETGVTSGRMRVEASDELANAPGKARKHLLETDAFTVDNAPPRFLLATVEGDKLHARVVDGLGPVARLEVAVDGKTKWTALDPVDGVFDDADETFDVDLPRLAAPGVRHVLTLRAFDRAGNSAVVETPWNP